MTEPIESSALLESKDGLVIKPTLDKPFLRVFSGKRAVQVAEGIATKQIDLAENAAHVRATRVYGNYNEAMLPADEIIPTTQIAQDIAGALFPVSREEQMRTTATETITHLLDITAVIKDDIRKDKSPDHLDSVRIMAAAFDRLAKKEPKWTASANIYKNFLALSPIEQADLLASLDHIQVWLTAMAINDKAMYLKLKGKHTMVLTLDYPNETIGVKKGAMGEDVLALAVPTHNGLIKTLEFPAFPISREVLSNIYTSTIADRVAPVPLPEQDLVIKEESNTITLPNKGKLTIVTSEMPDAPSRLNIKRLRPVNEMLPDDITGQAIRVWEKALGQENHLPFYLAAISFAAIQSPPYSEKKVAQIMAELEKKHGKSETAKKRMAIVRKFVATISSRVNTAEVKLFADAYRQAIFRATQLEIQQQLIGVDAIIVPNASTALEVEKLAKSTTAVDLHYLRDDVNKAWDLLNKSMDPDNKWVL